MTERQPEAPAVPGVTPRARDPLVMPADEFAAVQSVAAAFESAEVAKLREGARILGHISARLYRTLTAARIEMLLNGPHAGMQWILNAAPDLWDDPETEWDGREPAQAWFDRVDAADRAAEADSAAGVSDDTGRALPSVLAAPRERTGGTWRERAEAAEAALAAFGAHRPAILDALGMAAADTVYSSRAGRFTAALEALDGSEEADRHGGV